MRLLGAVLGIFLIGSSFAPQSEPLTTVDIWFNGFFGITGALLVLPVKKMVRYIRGKLIASILSLFAVLSLGTHFLVFMQNGATIPNMVLVTVVLYPLIFFNAYLFFNYDKL